MSSMSTNLAGMRAPVVVHPNAATRLTLTTFVDRLEFGEVKKALRKAGKYAGEAQIEQLLEAADKNGVSYA